MVTRVATVLVLAGILCASTPAAAQEPIRDARQADPFLGGIPTGNSTAEPLRLSLAEAIRRGLAHNLGMALAEQGVQAARSRRREARSDLLPQLSGRMFESRQITNLESFGFTGFPGVPTIIGPYSVFDARVYLSQQLLDMNAVHDVRAATATLRASEHSANSARDMVVLVVADLYLRVLASTSRVAAVEAQRDTAEALFGQATDLKAAGVVAGIDVLRARVQLLTQRQRLIGVENDLEKQRLQLARAIGLPIGQAFILTDEIAYAEVEAIGLEEARRRARRDRQDYRAAVLRVEAAEAARRAVVSERLPTIRLDADYGGIGTTAADARGTYRVAANLRVPIFEGGRLEARMLAADETLRRRRAELADFGARIDYDVRAAFLDVTAAREELQVARTVVQLADQELTQAQDRFSAGVASNVEVIQAQESVAAAADSYISSLYAHNVSKAALALAMGSAAEQMEAMLVGGRP